MTGPAGQVGHYYSVLGVPEGASLQVVQEAYEALERHWSPWVDLSGEHGDQARRELAAAQHAYRQLQSLKVQGKLVDVPDLPAVDKARAGCLLPVAATLVLGAFLWWPRSDPERTESDAFSHPAAQVPNSPTPEHELESGAAQELPQSSGDWVPEVQPVPPTPVADPVSNNPTPDSESLAEAETDVFAESIGEATDVAPGIETPATVSTLSETPVEAASAIAPSAAVPAPLSTPPVSDQSVEDSAPRVDQRTDPELPVAAPAAAGTFGLGSTQPQVRAVMGTPSAQYGNTWQYGYDSVDFENGRVKRYSNASGSLRIAIQPKVRSPKTTFSLGDTEDVILSVLGTPSAIYGNTWQYGYDSVDFENGRVSRYSNISGELKIKIAPQTHSTKPAFSLGDSQDVVLSVMGTPSAQYGNTWQYGYDSVEFENERVARYSNISGDLKVIVKPKIRSTKATFSPGDSQDVVLSVMGTPSAMYGNTWQYEYDTIDFENGRVTRYSNISGGLRVR